MRLAALLFALSIFLLPACGPSGDAPLRIAVAANARPAVEEIAAAFTRATATPVELSVASSGELVAQIRNGAPFDCFLSADMDYPTTLYKDGWATDTPMVYAYGRLIAWTSRDTTLSPGVAALHGINWTRIAIANPETAPYGRAAREVLQHEGLLTAWEDRLVYGESISKVNHYIQTGAVDLALTARSAVQGLSANYTEIESHLHAPIAQGMVMLKQSQKSHATPAQQFLAFMASDTARTILTRYGYGLPPQ